MGQDMDLSRNLDGAWGYVLGGFTLFISLVASAHALLHKRDPRAATLWIVVTWLLPLIGATLYFIFGINRIRRRRGRIPSLRDVDFVPGAVSAAELDEHLPGHTKHLRALVHVVDRAVERPLLAGNVIEPLINGDQAYPSMLDAISNARESIALSTYIFDRDEIGMRFAAELGAAVRRGVEVRVLIDATGTRYSFPTILRTLQREGVRFARFLPAFPLWRLVSLNLRNHRKIMVVDGRVGFTGGMNIRQGHLVKQQPRHPVQDIHFRVRGPVVAQFQDVFAEDWQFTTGESLRNERWFPKLQREGAAIVRAIADGPDEDFEKLRWTILGALTAARQSIRIMTPYFLPEAPIISALNLAAMRGVRVDIILPAECNLPFMTWASRAGWWQMLEHGCRIWLARPPFDHSKIMLVDGCWSLVGSANWDPRSLRLNFELNVESYDFVLAEVLDEIVSSKLEEAREVTLLEMDSRSYPVRLRDGFARLFTPYL
jgi:cardiolipin synthase A/B